MIYSVCNNFNRRKGRRPKETYVWNKIEETALADLDFFLPFDTLCILELIQRLHVFLQETVNFGEAQCCFWKAYSRRILLEQP